MYDFAIIGGGIVGLATGDELRSTLSRCADCSAGRKAVSISSNGNNMASFTLAFTTSQGVSKLNSARRQSLNGGFLPESCSWSVCGKVIVATETKELLQLENLLKRGLENGLNVTKISAEKVKEIEPHVRCLAGLRVPTTGIVDYKKHVSQKRLPSCVIPKGEPSQHKVEKSPKLAICKCCNGTFETRFVINCAGLHSDRIAS